MNSIVNYIVESSIALGILTTYYLLVLRNSNQLQFKRLYLVVSILFSTLLPLANFPLLGGSQEGNEALVYNVLESVTVYAGDFSTQAVPVLKSHNWLVYFYLAGFILLTVRLLLGLVRIRLMHGLFRSEKRGRYRLFITEGNFRPFSFFKWIFIPHQFMKNGTGEIILTHEHEHSRQWHSVDIMLLEILLIVQWFNPFIWIVRQEMKNNHEFMADRAVLQSGISKADYMQSMLFEMLGTKFDIANNFSLSITQKRIKMMKSNKVKQYLHGKATLASVLMFGLFFAFACETNPIKSEENSIQEEVLNLEEESKSASILEIDNEQVFMVVEQMPAFPRGNEALMQFLIDSIRYPKEAQKKGLQGRVYVSFIVGKDGVIRDVETVKGVDPILDNEAIRVVNLMPNWIPGKQRGKKVNVKYTLPVNFVLGESSPKQKGDASSTLHQIWLNKDKITVSWDRGKYDYTYKEGLGKVCQKSREGEEQVFTLFSDDITGGKKLLQSVQDKLVAEYVMENMGNYVIFKTSLKPVKEAQKEYDLLSTLVNDYLEKEKIANANEQVKLTSKDDSGFVFVVINALSSTISLNKKLEKYVIEHSGEVSYNFIRKIVKKTS